MFVIYQADDTWGFYRNPHDLNLLNIDKWKPAYMRLEKQTVNVLTRKVEFELTDVTDQTGASMMNVFIDSTTETFKGEENGPIGDVSGSSVDSLITTPGRGDSHIEGGGHDLQAEIPKL